MAPIALIWGHSGHIKPKADRVRALADERGETTALLEPGETPALRLNSDSGRRYRPDALADLADNNARLAALKEECGRHADLFSRGQRLFLDAYFAFVTDAITGHEEKLSEGLAWSGGLFEPADLVFAALLPLARAVIAEGDISHAADFAFWDGQEVVAISILASPPSPAKDEGTVRQIAVSPAELVKGAAIFRDERFPDRFRRFFDATDMPQGPFRPFGLPESLSLT